MHSVTYLFVDWIRLLARERTVICFPCQANQLAIYHCDKHSNQFSATSSERARPSILQLTPAHTIYLTQLLLPACTSSQILFSNGYPTLAYTRRAGGEKIGHIFDSKWRTLSLERAARRRSFYLQNEEGFDFLTDGLLYYQPSTLEGAEELRHQENTLCTT